MTFSIVACDDRHIGVATASHWVSVGALVPWAQSGVGAVATQAFTDPTYGTQGLALMDAGKSPRQAVDSLTIDDPDGELRQVIMLDKQSRIATMTGSGCFPERTSASANNAVAAGNMLANADVPEAMLRNFSTTSSPLPVRLIDALSAGQQAGGDARGRQAAALLVVTRAPPHQRGAGVIADLRIDDHPDPIPELYRLLELHNKSARVSSAAFPTANPALMTGDTDQLRTIISELTDIAHDTNGSATETALWLGLAHLRAGEKTIAQQILRPYPRLWDLACRWSDVLSSRGE
jgi:uncharacterized Ntn-hydrolase superfamily protein